MDAVNTVFNFTFIQPGLLIINICEFGLGNVGEIFLFVCFFCLRDLSIFFFWPREHLLAKMYEDSG